MRLKSSVAIYKMMIGRESRCIVQIETVHWLKYIVFMGPNWSWHIFLESFPQFSLYWVIGFLLISAVSMNPYVRPSVNITAPNSETKLCKENHIIYKTSCLLFFPVSCVWLWTVCPCYVINIVLLPDWARQLDQFHQKGLRSTSAEPKYTTM